MPTRELYAPPPESRSWARALWARFWVLLIVVPIFWIVIAVGVAAVVGGTALFVVWGPVDAVVSPLEDVVVEGSDARVSFTWGGAVLIAVTALMVNAASTCCMAAFASPFATVAVDAVQARDQNLFRLVVDSFKTFVRAWIGLFVFWLVVQVVAAIVIAVVSLLGGALESMLGTADFSVLTVIFAAGGAILYVALILKTVFITVNAARETPVFEPGFRREPMWVVAFGALWLAPILVVVLMGWIGLITDETSVVVVWLITQAVAFVVFVVTVFGSADIFQDARRRSRVAGRDWPEDAGVRAARRDDFVSQMFRSE